MAVWPLIWAATSNSLHTQRALALTCSLSLRKRLLSAYCMPGTVLDMRPQADLGELTRCSGPQMTIRPDVTCYCWEAVTPSDCHIYWASHSLRQSPQWALLGPRSPFHPQSLEDRFHSSSVHLPIRLVLPSVATRGRPAHRSSCRTVPHAHSRSRTCRARLRCRSCQVT